MKNLLLLAVFLVAGCGGMATDDVPRETIVGIISVQVGLSTEGDVDPNPGPAPDDEFTHKREDCPTDGWVKHGDGHVSRCPDCRPSWTSADGAEETSAIIHKATATSFKNDKGVCECSGDCSCGVNCRCATVVGSGYVFKKQCNPNCKCVDIEITLEEYQQRNLGLGYLPLVDEDNAPGLEEFVGTLDSVPVEGDPMPSAQPDAKEYQRVVWYWVPAIRKHYSSTEWARLTKRPKTYVRQTWVWIPERKEWVSEDTFEKSLAVETPASKTGVVENTGYDFGKNK